MDDLSAHLNLHLRFKRKRRADTDDGRSAGEGPSQLASPAKVPSLESLDPSDYDISVVSVRADIHQPEGDGVEPPPRVASTKRYALFADNLIYSWNNISVTTSDPISNPMVFWSEITDSDPPQKQGTQPLSGVAYGGEILAVLGGSGVGKSTLLRVLSFRHSSRIMVDGDRCINGIMVDHRIVHEISCYVPERDIFPPLVTVREYLIFHAMLRTKFESSYFERIDRVDHILRDCGLWELRDEEIGSHHLNCRNRHVSTRRYYSGISLVARKVLSIACEILADPRILFLESPTKGLDAGDAHWVMSELRKISAKGNMVISTFNRTSTETYEMFDRICIMTAGRITFQGAPAEATKLWNDLGFVCPPRHSPLDFFLSTVAVDPENEEECIARAEMITRAFRESVYFTRMQEDAMLRHWKTVSMARLEKRFFKDAARYKTSWWTQLVWCCKREMSIILRTKRPLYSRLLISMCSAILYGSIFWQQAQNDMGVQATASFFAATMVQTLLTSCAYAIISLGNDFEVLIRENYKRVYRTSSFYVAKGLCDLPACCLSPILFVIISYHMVGLGDIFSKTLRHGCTSLLSATFSATGIGYFFAALCGSTTSGLRIITTDILHLMCFSGLLINTETSLSFVGFIHNISMSYQIMENLMITQYSDVIIEPANSSLIHFNDGDGVLNFYQYDKRDLWQNYGALFAFCIVGLRLFAFVPLVTRLYLHRRFYPDV